jgi:tryptophanyl-tRNA synthetase
MNDQADHAELLRDLAARVAALEDNVAFLELWCEEQQDALDRYGDVYFYPDDLRDAFPERAHLYVIDGDDEDAGPESDLRDSADSRTIDLTTPAPSVRAPKRVDQKPAASGETSS